MAVQDRDSLRINKSDRASIWQRAEMLRGITQELEHATTRLTNRVRYGADSIPSADKETTRPMRDGLAGSLEDTYDELCLMRDRLLALVQELGERGEGPRGELKTERPAPEYGKREYALDATAPERQRGERYG